MKKFGFTLIELLWSIAIAAILSSVGIAAFLNYSRTQALNAAVSDFTTMLQLAKFRAASQVKPTDATATFCNPPLFLSSYEVVINKESGTYQLNAVCSDGSMYPIVNQVKTLPNGISFSCISPSTASWVSFQVLTGKANYADNGAELIELSGFNRIKTVSVSQSGVIQLEESRRCALPQ